MLLAAAAMIGSAPRVESLDLKTDSTPIDRNQRFLLHSYAGMLEEVTPAVVSVHTARVVRVVRSQGMSPEELLLRRFFGIPYSQGGTQAEPEERRLPQGIGSGVIVSADGYIVTNNHVVTSENGDDADEILVSLNDGRELEAEIVGRDPLTDVAIIKVDAKNLPAITIADSDNIAVGDVVFAIGNPMGVGLTVTQGIVSAKNRSIGIYGERGYENFIQTDASINPGNSGGALVDSEGRLVGVNSAILSRSGGNIGIGFAIPSNLAMNISTQLVEGGEVRRGFLGVTLSDLTPELAEAFGVPGSKGALIQDVEKGSAADVGGIKPGDIVLAIDGKPVDSANQFRIRVGNTVPGTKVEMEVIRDQKPAELEVAIGEASGFFAGSANELFEGVEVSAIDDEQARKYRLPENLEGLLISSVAPDSPFSRYMSEGMVIVEINDRPVVEIAEARETLRTGANKIYFYHRGRLGYLAIRLP